MKKEISLRKVIETLSAHDNRAEDARLISIHTMELADGMNHVFRIRHADGFIRAVRIPLYEEIKKPILTKEEAVKRHRMMWNWIAYDTLRREEYVTKREALEHFGWDGSKMHSSCWCCTYAREHGSCEDCPIQWPEGKCASSVGVKGLYDEWCYMRWRFDHKKAADLAYQIANLPEREDVE